MKKLKFMIKSGSKIFWFKIGNITHIIGDAQSTTIFFKDGSETHTAETLKYYVSNFGEELFRINRNIAVNISHIEEVNIKKREVLLRDKKPFRISYRQIKTLLRQLKSV